MKRCMHTMLVIAITLLHSSSVYSDDADELAALLTDVDQLPKMSSAGRIVLDREMARAMIEYGRRTKTPEVIIFGVQILAQNPVNHVVENDEIMDRDKAELTATIQQAVDMRDEDETLIELSERAADLLDEKTRGLAGGPRRWTVTIDKGKYYQLDPRLVYHAQQRAIVTAFAHDVMLGASVRRSDQRKELKRSVGSDKVKVAWNSGIHTSGWDVRIYNLNGPDNLRVQVETN